MVIVLLKEKIFISMYELKVVYPIKMEMKSLNG